MLTAIRHIMRWVGILVCLGCVSALLVAISGFVCLYTGGPNSIGEMTRHCGLPVPYRFESSSAAWAGFDGRLFALDVVLVSSAIVLAIRWFGRPHRTGSD